jgi:hypothetical protein
VHEQAETWARRVLAEVGSPDERIARMYVSAFGREPTEKECGACLAFVKEQARLHGTSTNALPPWKDLAHTLFNVKEFIFLN